MVKFTNKNTGSDMWVADSRKDEYLAAGHKLAASVSEKAEKPAKSIKEEVSKVVRKTTRKEAKK